MIGPYRGGGALVAKQALTVHALSGGRLVLGIAAGGREDDFQANRADFAGRGAHFDEQLADMVRVFAGEEMGYAGAVGPPAGPPPVLVGGRAPAAFRRAAAHAGWVMGGGSPDQFREGAATLAEAWRKAGRDGEPRTMALAYFALGDRAEEAAQGYLGHYYGWLGEGATSAIAGSAAKDPGTASGYAQAFEAAGCGELMFFPCDPDPDQVDLLADALGLG
jgi:alkanesulfonate monooxygenase SsuD/methylene tetrahydromethanopterin reductase-like flavin-dependent oxidoreductase (luciferase family)